MHWTAEAWSTEQDDGTFYVRRDGRSWRAEFVARDGHTIEVGRFNDSWSAKAACAWTPKVAS